MPLKIESEVDISLFVNEPIYDEKALIEYAKQKGVSIEALSEAEKQPFISGYIKL